ncbi:MAG: hypothetical protein ACFFEV_06435, partial [Candidatus Thorarchaeota archaeon]
SLITEITRLTSNLKLQVKLRKEINAQADRPSEEFHDIWIDIPDSPTFGDSIGFDVVVAEGQYVDMNELFELTQWLKAYATNKWRGHVFAMGEDIESVKSAAISVFEGYDVKFKDFA